MVRQRRIAAVLSGFHAHMHLELMSSPLLCRRCKLRTDAQWERFAAKLTGVLQHAYAAG